MRDGVAILVAKTSSLAGDSDKGLQTLPHVSEGRCMQPGDMQPGKGRLLGVGLGPAGWSCGGGR